MLRGVAQSGMFDVCRAHTRIRLRGSPDGPPGEIGTHVEQSGLQVRTQRTTPCAGCGTQAAVFAASGTPNQAYLFVERVASLRPRAPPRLWVRT